MLLGISRDWNVVPRPQLFADSSLLFIRLSILFSASFLFYSFFLFPFSRFLLAVTYFRLSSPPAFSLSLDEIIRLLMRDSLFSALLILIQRINSLERCYV